MNEFSGKTALVTGAASGIGAATARWLDERGIARLILVDCDGATLSALPFRAQTRCVAGDVTDEALWSEIEATEPVLHHAVLNAGVADGCPIASLDFAEWRRILSVNLDGMFLSLRAALRLMTREGDSTGRSAVLTSSVAGLKPVAMTAAYGSSKAAVAHLTRIAAAEYAQQGIRINAVAPGRVDTPIWTKNAHFQAMVEELGSREAALDRLAEDSTPLGRFATADEMAGQIGFLLSQAAWNVTGTVLVSDGGYSL
ncbi:SDR family NAD(P)-dependent oxidoreductase [Novosphingobium album (ex Hu et al. 2023)]|uniref:SDR family oxidoreductase n=1 Tax=Novosphingobium album (ex Hu et al. 2023) TaxID=2930093 RepID=A0ABT0AYT0_9SPHN|nr:SDR family oxidoreductase [Novosphingobium album (ex Hu et al. 2023)]MCJ2177953.1 SDR family oxidoreductase [Novosphingobium album (ex Hu et al. 2023)]